MLIVLNEQNHKFTKHYKNHFSINMMILPLIFLAFLYIEPALSSSNNSLIFAYGINGKDEPTNYQRNLRYLLWSLSSQTTITRFSNFTTTLTKPPNQLHGIYLCRGDIDPQSCQSCINSARKFILRFNPNGKEGIVWYNHCMIRYSNESFLGKFDEKTWTVSRDNKKVEGNRVQFMNILGRTLKGLSTQASNGQNKNKFASTFVKLDAFNLHAMAQCTPDLVASDCYRCLMYANEKILGKSYGSTSVRALYKNCFVQYKTSHAFSDNKVELLPMLPSPTIKNSPIFQLRVQIKPIQFSNNSDPNLPITNPTRICFRVRFSNNTVNSSSTPLSWTIANSSSSSPSWKVELKELNLDDGERYKELATA